MKQFWSRLSFMLVASAGFLITVMEPELSLFKSIYQLSGIDWMGWIMVAVPAFMSPTQIREIIGKK